MKEARSILQLVFISTQEVGTPRFYRKRHYPLGRPDVGAQASTDPPNLPSTDVVTLYMEKKLSLNSLSASSTSGAQTTAESGLAYDSSLKRDVAELADLASPEGELPHSLAPKPWCESKSPRN